MLSFAKIHLSHKPIRSWIWSLFPTSPKTNIFTPFTNFTRCSKCLWRCTTHSSFEFLRYHGFSDVQFLITLFAGQDHTYPSDCVSACINWLCKSAEFWGIASKFLQLDRPKQQITFQLDKPARLSFSCYLDLLQYLSIQLSIWARIWALHSSLHYKKVSANTASWFPKY